MCVHTTHVFHSSCNHTTLAPSMGPGYIVPRHCNAVTAWLRAYHEQPFKPPQPVPMAPPRACSVLQNPVELGLWGPQCGVATARSDSFCPACHREQVLARLKCDEDKSWRRVTGKFWVGVEKRSGNDRSGARRRHAAARGRRGRVGGLRGGAHSQPRSLSPEAGPSAMIFRRGTLTTSELPPTTPLAQSPPAAQSETAASQPDTDPADSLRMVGKKGPLILEGSPSLWTALPHRRRRVVTGAGDIDETSSDRGCFSGDEDGAQRRASR